MPLDLSCKPCSPKLFPLKLYVYVHMYVNLAYIIITVYLLVHTVATFQSSVTTENKNQASTEVQIKRMQIRMDTSLGSTKSLICFLIFLSISISFILTAAFLYMLYLPMARQQTYLENKVILLQNHIDSVNFDHKIPIYKYERKKFQLEVTTAHHHYPMIPSSNQVAPVVLAIVNFTEKLQKNETWKSKPFFAFGGGYLMYMSVYASGNGDGNGTHLSVYLHLLEGPYDDDLQWSGYWPLRGTFTIELLNQSSFLHKSNHYGYRLQQSYFFCWECTRRVIDSDEDPLGWGFSQFISHQTLLHQNASSYFKNGTLYFRISYLYSILNKEDYSEIIKSFLLIMAYIFGYHLLYMACLYVFGVFVMITEHNKHFEIKMQYCDAIFPGNMVIPILIVEVVVAAIVMLTIMIEHMEIDDSITIGLNCSLLRLFVVALYNYCGYIALPFVIYLKLLYRSACTTRIDECKKTLKEMTHSLKIQLKMLKLSICHKVTFDRNRVKIV